MLAEACDNRGCRDTEAGVPQRAKIVNAMTNEGRLVRIFSQIVGNRQLVNLQLHAQGFRHNPIILTGFQDVRSCEIEDAISRLWIAGRAEHGLGEIGRQDGLLQEPAASDQAELFAGPQPVDEFRIPSVKGETSELGGWTVDMAGPKNGPSHGAGIPVDQGEFAEPFAPAVIQAS